MNILDDMGMSKNGSELIFEAVAGDISDGLDTYEHRPATHQPHLGDSSSQNDPNAHL